MASPIIKIKRGIGQPGSWDGTSGITGGEFAFDRQNNVLYIGVTGGFCGFDGSPLADGIINTIQVGMQVSNDETFGGNTPTLEGSIGYSDFTVPTTSAVRQFVATQFAESALGVTFREGVGIGITFAVDGTDVDVSIRNTGVLRGYTAISFDGNYIGNSRIDPSSNADLLKYYADSGVQLNVEKSGGFDQIRFTNVGVTGINGFTGNIKSIDPIITLTGFTLAASNAIISNLTAVSPIEFVSNTSTGKMQLSHSTQNSAGTYGGPLTIPQITIDAYGHITGSSNVPITVGTSGITEFVQDIIGGFVTGDWKENGIGFTYDDNSGYHNAFISGIRNLGVFGSQGLCGAVKLVPGTGVALNQNPANNQITISNTAPKFTQIVGRRGVELGSGDIYAGGTVGFGSENNTIVADAVNDTINIYAGKGIGISGGESSLSSDALLIWNTGVNSFRFYNDTNTQVGGTYDGDVQLYASNGVAFTTSGNGIRITSSGEGAVGMTSLKASYEPSEDAEGDLVVWNNNGVTGNASIVGRNGIITKQTIDSSGPPDGTRDGDIFIGLSSHLVIPNLSYEGNFPEQRTKLVISSWAGIDGNTGDYGILTGPATNYSGMPGLYHYAETDMIVGGLTGILTYGGNGYYSPDYSAYTPNISTLDPGKILMLAAEAGWVDINGGANPGVGGLNAEVRLLAYPNAENLSAELDRVQVPNGGGVYPCGGQLGCVGMPPILPSCRPWDGEISDSIYYASSHVSASDAHIRPSVKINGDLILRDSMFVENDIWLNGNLIDAKTGCLISGSGGGAPGGNAVTCIECKGNGNVGVTGSLTVVDNLYVHGTSAFFNTDNISTSASFFSIGGLSGDQQTTTPGALDNPANNDRGFKIYHRSILPTVPGVASSARTDRVSYVGIKNDTGMFTYIPTATFNISGGNRTTVSGGPGAAHFAMYNGVGLTAASTEIQLRIPSSASQTSSSLKTTGNVRLTQTNPTDNETNPGEIKLTQSSLLDIQTGSVAPITFASTINSPVTFVRGVTFDTGTGVYSGTAGAAGHQFLINWRGTDAGVIRSVAIRNNGQNTYTQLVDVGRKSTSSTGSLDTVGGSVSEGDIQVLYNKHLADGTVIDCGTY